MKVGYRYRTGLLGVTLLVVALLLGCGADRNAAQSATTLDTQAQVLNNETLHPNQPAPADIASASPVHTLPVSLVMFDEPG